MGIPPRDRRPVRTQFRPDGRLRSVTQRSAEGANSELERSVPDPWAILVRVGTTFSLFSGQMCAGSRRVTVWTVGSSSDCCDGSGGRVPAAGRDAQALTQRYHLWFRTKERAYD